MDDVAIIGVRLHPFGRFGPKSAIDMGPRPSAPRCDAGRSDKRSSRSAQLRGGQPER
jgi:hypothetical protein